MTMHARLWPRRLNRKGIEMKMSKQMQRKPIKAPKILMIDEAWQLFGSNEYQDALRHQQSFVRRPSAGFVATQAMMKFNSGKRVRFLGAVRRADGSSLKPTPKKFLPAQVIRRMTA